MKKLKGFWRGNSRLIILILFGLVLAAGLLVYKLATLTGGVSDTEVLAATMPVGWHGIYADPLYLPLKLVRSVAYWAAPSHGAFLTRLPNVFFGLLAITSFAGLIWLWHGTRTAILSTLLFMTGAWTLHTSRLASFDVLYLGSVPTLLLIHVLLHRQGQKAAVWYASLLAWGLMLYIPGLVWLVLLQLYLQRALLWKAWTKFATWQRRLISVLICLLFLSLLIIGLSRHGQLLFWLGIPAHLPNLLEWAKHLAGVFVHLFIRGPQYAELWLGRAPLLDIFSLVASIFGIYFYATHWKASRSRLLVAMFAVSALLVSLGVVSFSLVVPFAYITVATGLAYLLHEWLKVFPQNPVARSLGIGLIILAVGLSCVYNLRAYFVAWPHNYTTKVTFIHQL